MVVQRATANVSRHSPLSCATMRWRSQTGGHAGKATQPSTEVPYPMLDFFVYRIESVAANPRVSRSVPYDALFLR